MEKDVRPEETRDDALQAPVTTQTPQDASASAEGKEPASVSEAAVAREEVSGDRKTTDDRESKGVSRRDLFAGIGCAAVMLGLGAGVKYFGDGSLLRPPGGQDEERLLSLCVRCQRCYEACPQKAIVPAALDGGFLNLRTPTVDFHAGWCDFCEEHNDGRPLCAQACPTEALHVDEDAKREDVVIGEAYLVTDWCLAYRMTRCRECYDACELDAITLDDAVRPHLDLDKCNGCGACEYVCPSLTAGTPVAGATHRAIIIVPVGEGGEA